LPRRGIVLEEDPRCRGGTDEEDLPDCTPGSASTCATTVSVQSPDPTLKGAVTDASLSSYDPRNFAPDSASLISLPDSPAAKRDASSDRQSDDRVIPSGGASTDDGQSQTTNEGRHPATARHTLLIVDTLVVRGIMSLRRVVPRTPSGSVRRSGGAAFRAGRVPVASQARHSGAAATRTSSAHFRRRPAPHGGVVGGHLEANSAVEDAQPAASNRAAPIDASPSPSRCDASVIDSLASPCPEARSAVGIGSNNETEPPALCLDLADSVFSTGSAGSGWSPAAAVPRPPSQLATSPAYCRRNL
jgi:hypothetical protein